MAKKKSEKGGKWQMHTIRPEIWQETLKKLIMHTLGPVICRGNWKKMWKMRNAHFTTWNMARKPKKLEKRDTNNVLPGR